MTRECPKCNSQIMYRSERSYHTACKRLTQCESCRAKARRSKNVECSDVTRHKMSLSHQGERNHFFGQTHTPETRRKIGQTTLDRNQSGERNPFYGRNHSSETRARMSLSRALGLASGRINNINQYGQKSWYTSTKTSVLERCDSMLERFRMTQLDNDASVMTWTKKHGIKIPYVYKETSRHFIPDFLITSVSGEMILEEVKGYDVKAAEKRRALEEFCVMHSLIVRWTTQSALEAQGYLQFKQGASE